MPTKKADLDMNRETSRYWCFSFFFFFFFNLLKLKLVINSAKNPKFVSGFKKKMEKIFPLPWCDKKKRKETVVLDNLDIENLPNPTLRSMRLISLSANVRH